MSNNGEYWWLNEPDGRRRNWIYLLVLTGLDELMVERAVAAADLVQHLPEPSVLLAGLPELTLYRRHIHLSTHVYVYMGKDFHVCS